MQGILLFHCTTTTKSGVRKQKINFHNISVSYTRATVEVNNVLYTDTTQTTICSDTQI